MPQSKRRKTNKSGSRANSRASTPVPTSRSASPVPTLAAAGKGTLITSSNQLNPPLVLTSEKARGVYECDYCHSDISRLPRIRCARCPDFDLCLECFLTTDHTSAIARLKAAVEARTAVDNLNATGGHHAQHQGKQAPVGAVGGGVAASSAVSSAWHTGSGAINHDDSHGYRVCDNTRYPLFPNPLKVRVGTRPKGFPGGTDKDAEEPKPMEVDGETSPTTSNNEEKEELLKLIPDDPKAIWTVEEDLRLLDGISAHGLGNWVDIAESVGGLGSSGKTPKRCMERYFDEFLGRYGRILPPFTLVEDETEEEKEGDANSAAGGESKDDAKDASSAAGNSSATGSVSKDVDPTRLSKRRHCINVRTSSSASAQPFHRFNKRLKAVRTETLPEYQEVLKLFPPRVPDKDPKVEFDQRVLREEAARMEKQFVQLINSVDKKTEEQIRKEWEPKLLKPGGPTVLPVRPEDVVKLPGAELAGFMPRRGDFDIEWENEAETALADMEFLPGDLPEDKKLKLQVLQIYNEKLDEREKRKNFILSRNLHDYRKNQEADAKLPRDERDLVRRMRLFERFHSPEEHKQFLADILKAKHLRKEIAKFQMYRRMGITSVIEAEKYELDKSRRNFHKMAVLQKEAAAAKAGADKSGAAAGAAAGATGAAASATTTPTNTASKKEEKAAAEPQLWKSYTNTSASRRRSSLRDGIVSVSSEASAQSSAAAGGAPPKQPSPMKIDDEEGGSKKADDESGSGKDKDNKDKPETASGEDDDFVLEKMDGFNLLSSKEANLCRKIQLTPKEYMEVKKVLIHESLKSGLLDKEGSSKRTLVNIDVEKRGEVIDFMVQAAWLPNKLSITRTISE